MEITEIRIFPKEGQDKKLRAYATVTFDHEFVVRNIKIIQGTSGMFVAMPSRKMKFSCPRCRFKNEVGSKFCNQCGGTITAATEEGEARDAKADHRDIAHPITQKFRHYLQSEIFQAFDRDHPISGQ
ncbi:MAG: SpoVG family protein [Candidatus Omnitrophota bacterium]